MKENKQENQGTESNDGEKLQKMIFNYWILEGKLTSELQNARELEFYAMKNLMLDLTVRDKSVGEINIKDTHYSHYISQYFNNSTQTKAIKVRRI